MGPRPEPGDEIRAEHIAELFKLGESLGLSVDGLDMASTPGGRSLSVPRRFAAWAKITAGSNPYSWTEQVPRSAGTWADGRSGTLSAYESNVVTTVPANTIVWLKYEPAAGTLVFTY